MKRILPPILMLWLACSTQEDITPAPDAPLTGGTTGGSSTAAGQAGASPDTVAGHAGSLLAGTAGVAGMGATSLGGQGGMGLAGSAGSPLDAGAAGSLAGAGIAGAAGALPAAGAAGVGASAGEAGAAGSSPQTCPADRGPAMVRIPTASGSFCIDSTEVSQADFRGFLLAKGTDVSGQPEMCTYKKSWGPPPYNPVETGENCEPPEWGKSPANRPMVCVDWCDAHAYCEWAGKRLCDKVGGGNMKETEQKTPQSEYVFACTQGGTTNLPYGNTYASTPCTVKAGGGMGAKISLESACHGAVPPYTQVYDLVGNVDEWSGSPNYKEVGTSGDYHWVAFVHSSSISEDVDPAQSTCTRNYQTLFAPDLNVGFRCCAD